MGRAFEYRKASKMKRWGAMSKLFPKLGKIITMAAKEGSSDPDMNSKLRTAILNAKAENMPKDNIEAAIKRASAKDTASMSEINYEGKAPFGVLIFVESATDNNTRTVSNIRSYFNKYGGSLGKDGCLEFIFSRKGIFLLQSEGLEEEDFTMEMIDVGAEDVEFEEDAVFVSCEMEDFGNISKRLQEMELEPKEAGLKRIPVTTKEINQKDYPKFEKLIDVIEDDDDVQKVYHNVVMKEG